MEEKELIEKCNAFLKEVRKDFGEKCTITYYGEPIENIIEQLLILIDAKNEEIRLHIQDNNVLSNRLKHLLLSKIIKEYDAKDGKRKLYKRY